MPNPTPLIVGIARSWARDLETVAQIAARLGWPQSRVINQISRLVLRYSSEGLYVDSANWKHVVMLACDHYDPPPAVTERLE